MGRPWHWGSRSSSTVACEREIAGPCRKSRRIDGLNSPRRWRPGVPTTGDPEMGNATRYSVESGAGLRPSGDSRVRTSPMASWCGPVCRRPRSHRDLTLRRKVAKRERPVRMISAPWRLCVRHSPRLAVFACQSRGAARRLSRSFALPVARWRVSALPGLR